MRQQLIGYLFDALSPDERAAVERRLQDEPAWQDELACLQREVLLPCDETDSAPAPPPRLAERTLDYVFALSDETPLDEVLDKNYPTSVDGQPVVCLSPAREVAPTRSRFNVIDMATAAGLLLAITLLLIPAVGKSRFVARVDECQNNLRQISLALASYSGRHEGLFPQVPTEGPLAAAGMYAHTLVESGDLANARVVLCPASTLAEKPDEFHLPNIKELALAAKAQLARWRRTMGGSYGYTLGYVENGEYQPTRNLQRPRFAIMADTPLNSPATIAAAPQVASDNHAGLGQNVLFEDGHVRFMETRFVPETADDIYANDQGMVAAGIHADDAVIAPSAASPLVWSGSQCSAPLELSPPQSEP